MSSARAVKFWVFVEDSLFTIDSCRAKRALRDCWLALQLPYPQQQCGENSASISSHGDSVVWNWIPRLQFYLREPGTSILIN